MVVIMWTTIYNQCVLATITWANSSRAARIRALEETIVKTLLF